MFDNNAYYQEVQLPSLAPQLLGEKAIIKELKYLLSQGQSDERQH